MALILNCSYAEEICKRMQNGDLKVFLDPNNNQSPLIPSQNCKCN